MVFCLLLDLRNDSNLTDSRSTRSYIQIQSLFFSNIHSAALFIRFSSSFTCDSLLFSINAQVRLKSNDMSATICRFIQENLNLIQPFSWIQLGVFQITLKHKSLTPIVSKDILTHMRSDFTAEARSISKLEERLENEVIRNLAYFQVALRASNYSHFFTNHLCSF